jgi:hypothetical protein
VAGVVGQGSLGVAGQGEVVVASSPVGGQSAAGTKTAFSAASVVKVAIVSVRLIVPSISRGLDPSTSPYRDMRPFFLIVP